MGAALGLAFKAAGLTTVLELADAMQSLKKTDPHVTQALDGGRQRFYHGVGNRNRHQGQLNRHARTAGNSMAKMTISLPDNLADYISRRVASGRYDSADAFLAELIAKDQDHRKLEDDELREILRQAEESGISDRRIPDILLETKVKLRDINL
ncbi:antitoxin ParD1/3/4 [Rhizobium sp. BK049]|nr:antitoxin ParD1/3/4 [Rhizobium sp. BK049]